MTQLSWTPRMPVEKNSPEDPPENEGDDFMHDRFLLWIDGVGAYLLCLGDSVTIGGPGHRENPADICLLANLSRCHATITRQRQEYLLDAHSLVRVADRLIDNRIHLDDGYDIQLGTSVRLRFRVPTPLSATATLDFVSDHRPAQNVDGIILMEQTCLLGPGVDNHVRCPHWSDSVLLFLNEGEFRFKSKSAVLADGKPIRNGESFAPGEIVAGPDFRFRVEPAGHWLSR